LGNARRLVLRHGHDLRYCHTLKAWFVWNGRRWRKDETGEVERRTKDMVGGIFEEIPHADPSEADEIAKFAFKSQHKERIRAAIALTQSELPVTVDELDQHPSTLNLANGMLDLTTGALRPHRRDDLCTKLAPVVFDQSAKCPTWLAFLDRIFGSDRELI